MKIEYENRFLDILVFNLFHQILSPLIQMLTLTLPVGMIFLEYFILQKSLLESIETGVVYYFLTWTIQLVFNGLYLFSKKDKSILTRHIIEIQDESLYEETKYNRSYFYWDGINKVVYRPGFVAVYVTKHMAHVIPERAFESKTQMKQFLCNVEEKIENARILMNK